MITNSDDWKKSVIYWKTMNLIFQVQSVLKTRDQLAWNTEGLFLEVLTLTYTRYLIMSSIKLEENTLIIFVKKIDISRYICSEIVYTSKRSDDLNSISI